MQKSQSEHTSLVKLNLKLCKNFGSCPYGVSKVHPSAQKGNYRLDTLREAQGALRLSPLHI